MMNSIKKHTICGLMPKADAMLFLRAAVISCLLSLISCLALAQEERGMARDGNKAFNKGKYADAEAAYKKALEKKAEFPEAIFNLGDAMYKQERYDDAISHYQSAAKLLKDPKQKGLAYHNIGNCQLEKKEYEKAVEAYKQALRINPNDKDTRYNLAYANDKLREKQKQDQQNKDKKQDKKDQKDKDQKDKDKKPGQNDKDKKEGQDKQDKGGQGDKKDEQKKPGQPSKLTKEQAEKILQSLSPEEKKALEKIIKANQKPVEVKVEKDW